MEQFPVPDVAYIVCDTDFIITEASEHAAYLFGLETVDMRGSLLTDIFLPLIGSEPLIENVINGIQPYLSLEQVNIRTSHGEVRYISLVLFAHTPGILIIINDVTSHSVQQQFLQQQHHDLLLLHEKVAEQNKQLNILNEELSEMSQRKSDMLAIATHDLRSPLVAILGYIELLYEGEFDPLTDEQHGAIRIIEQESQRMLTLIKTLLDLKRLETSRLQYRYSVNLDKLVSQVVNSFSNQAHLAHITLDYSGVQGIADNLSLIVSGDRDILQQAVANLVSNGIKYAGEGKRVELHLTALETLPSLKSPLDPEQTWCTLDVSDNGPGLNEEDVQRVFDPFFRTRDARTKNQTGSGLGLTIVQRAVQHHNGQVSVQSTPGEGTTFTLFLPCTLIEGEA